MKLITVKPTLKCSFTMDVILFKNGFNFCVPSIEKLNKDFMDSSHAQSNDDWDLVCSSWRIPAVWVFTNIFLVPVFFSACIILIPLWEERDLKNRFGEDYLIYKKNVPRWLPRFKPWQG
jgi:hypothetical protein